MASQVSPAERLALRSEANVSQQLRCLGSEQIKGKVPQRLASFVERATAFCQDLHTDPHLPHTTMKRQCVRASPFAVPLSGNRSLLLRPCEAPLQ